MRKEKAMPCLATSVDPLGALAGWKSVPLKTSQLSGLCICTPFSVHTVGEKEWIKIAEYQQFQSNLLANASLDKSIQRQDGIMQPRQGLCSQDSKSHAVLQINRGQGSNGNIRFDKFSLCCSHSCLSGGRAILCHAESQYGKASHFFTCSHPGSIGTTYSGEAQRCSLAMSNRLDLTQSMFVPQIPKIPNRFTMAYRSGWCHKVQRLSLAMPTGEPLSPISPRDHYQQRNPNLGH
jgi:hypothetical protein